MVVAIGAELAGYRLKRAIGEGGMAIVYLAERVPDGEPAVLKVLREELSGDEGFRRRFLRESGYARSLEHPNVVKVLDAGETGGVLYIAMEYIEGIDLYALLEEEAPLDPQLTVTLLAQVADAIDAAHATGLLHRDVKPGNVLIKGAGEPAPRAFLTDFGLSKHTAKDSRALTEAGSFVGTIAYTAPEQIVDQAPGPPADVYSLGCVLYECLTGHPPFSGSEVEMMQAQVENEPPKLSGRRSRFPAEIDAVIQKALAKEPSARYGTCVELVQAAAKALGVEAPAAVPSAGDAEAGRRLELLVTAGNAVGQTLAADGDLVIGRGEDAAGRLGEDPEISRRHARISRGPTGALTIEDLGSTNGTFLNGRPTAGAQTLCSGDEIELGSTKLLVRPAPPEPVGAVESASMNPRITLRLDVDFAAGEAQLRLDEQSTALRVMLVDGRWRMEG